MSSSLSKDLVLGLTLLCTLFVPYALPLVNVNGEAQTVTFTRTPTTYNNKTGFFRLDWELSNYVSDSVCLSYDYFLFKAEAGQSLRGEVLPGSTGNRGVFYVILNSPIGLYNFEGTDCGLGFWRLKGFTSPSTLNWTAPEDGRYALVFMVSGFYSGPVYFLAPDS